MRSFRASISAQRLSLAAGIVILVCGGYVLPASAQEAATGGEKSGFLGRIFGKKQEPAPAPPPPPPPAPPPPETKPVASKGSSTTAKGKGGAPSVTVTSTSSKGKGTSSTAKKSSPKSSTTAKSTPKPAEKKPDPEKKSEPEKKTEPDKTAVAKKEEPKKEEPSSTDEKAKTATASASSKPVTPSNSDVAIQPGSDKPMDVTSTAKASAGRSASQLTESPSSSTPALPLARNAAWEVVKHNGRDYVTAESMKNFYPFATYNVVGNNVWMKSSVVVLKAQVGQQDIQINNVKFVLSYPVESVGGKVLISRLDLCKLIDPILRPNHISGAEAFDTVILDAGHGGHDTGAVGGYGREKDFALKMAYAVKPALEKRGFKVILTRSNDTFISRTVRVALANRTPNCIFISLHFNSGGSSASGIETFALTPQGGSASLERGGGYNAYGLTGNRQDSENIALATAIHSMVMYRFNMAEAGLTLRGQRVRLLDRGVKRAQWTVLTGCQKPGVLFEGGFITNGTEGYLIATENYRLMLANAIGDAVVNYHRALKPAYSQQQRR